MALIKTPYSLELTINDKDLREVSNDPIQMEKGLAFLINKADKSEDQKYIAQAIGQAGALARILGKFDQSNELLLKAKGIYDQLDMKINSLLLEVRIGILSQWKGRHDLAVNTYEATIISLSNSKYSRKQLLKLAPLKSFTLFHFGKCRFEQKRFVGAMDLFVECYEIRLAQGEVDLIESTQYCMSLTQLKIDQASEN